MRICWTSTKTPTIFTQHAAQLLNAWRTHTHINTYMLYYSFPTLNVLFKYLGLCIINVVAEQLYVLTLLFSRCFFFLRKIKWKLEEHSFRMKPSEIEFLWKFSTTIIRCVADLAEILLKSSERREKSKCDEVETVHAISQACYTIFGNFDDSHSHDSE